MSRIKLILSILLMLFLLLVAIFLPSRLRERKETPDTKSQEETATQEESNQPEKLTEMDFLSFEEPEPVLLFRPDCILKGAVSGISYPYRADRHYVGRISAG